jgi:tetratricopeptide (TPR) repeat protein
LKPDYLDACVNIGIALSQEGRMAEAMAQYQLALQMQPVNPTVQNSLAWLLATCAEESLRNGDTAVGLASQANHLCGGENPIVLHTLAAAYAEAGRFSEAMETAEHALRLAEEQSKTGLAGQLQFELKLYQAGRAFHSPAQTH